MRKLYIIKTTREFEKIINQADCKKNKYYVIYHMKNSFPYDRYGISVSKKIGNAVFRNQYKRKLRAIIDNYKKTYINKEDYIIILRKEATKVSYEILEKEFFALMNQDRKGKQNHEKE